MMTNRDAIRLLEGEYDRSIGFLGLLRQGVLREADLARFLGILRSIDVQPDSIDKRLVQLLWYLPLIIEWQAPRFEEARRHEVERVATQVIGEVERIIGVP